MHELVFSVDLEEWFHSRRWVEGPQRLVTRDSRELCRSIYGCDRPAGEIIAPTRALLELFDRYNARVTFFVLGEIAEWYPDLVCEISRRGHEIACHGMYHTDMTLLGPDEFACHLEKATGILTSLTGRRPVGYRAPNLVYEPWATRLLEQSGYLYDTTVCVSRPLGGKYKGWLHAPIHPYHPSYEAIGEDGCARLVELPLPPFPVLKIAAGSGILTRVVGFHWTMTALRTALKSGDTAFYFHPWEVASRPAAKGHAFRNAVFLRRTGPWMLNTVERILAAFKGRIAAAERVAAKLVNKEIEYEKV